MMIVRTLFRQNADSIGSSHALESQRRDGAVGIVCERFSSTTVDRRCTKRTYCGLRRNRENVFLHQLHDGVVDLLQEMNAAPHRLADDNRVCAGPVDVLGELQHRMRSRRRQIQGQDAVGADEPVDQAVEIFDEGAKVG